MIGNNACGSRSLAYGRTSDNVAGLGLLTAAGDRLVTGYENGVAVARGSETVVSGVRAAISRGHTRRRRPHRHPHRGHRALVHRRAALRRPRAAARRPGCCGLAGNFGVERGHYEVSVAVAGQNLLPALDTAPDAVVLADGFSCRAQIADLRDRPALHLAQLLDR
ncbi:Glycolate dehydrogenase, subunit GlcD [Pseudonocardia sp. Ae168_Ps1]|nr:Glycolate dehydrogenase, subunit GlcD [Pseudonocardia sp. Ae150A_Ps1]OLL79477.1 Glycolate dehydrogenase, subunit GlcD [Pseudonocardia sp. Ae168_Ps1]OLL86389.1 Glycolate dehydrogenase, subunit GlcD [Pseudonocardia sp. Ae263_Ps1]OLL93570.1 Glycolate dehydrogenase, subunit GlcD [Pseudonocardia sp. Ae356_Ps1]